MRPIRTRACRRFAPVLCMAIAIAASVLCSGAVVASVLPSLQANLWEIVPLDDPVFEDLERLADLGLISYPETADESRFTRYDVAYLIYRASREIDSTQGSGLSFNDSDGQEILAGLRSDYADEIQWVRWAYASIPVFDDGEPIVDRLGSGFVPGISEREGISVRLEEHRDRIATSVPPLSTAALAVHDIGTEMTYSTDPLTVRIFGTPGLTLNVAGTLSSVEGEEAGSEDVSPYALYPESVRGLKYRIDAEARSPGLELRFSHEGLSSMPRHSISADSSHSEASAIYEISPDVRLVAGMIVRSSEEGITSESGVDLRFQVVPMYLSASLGLNVVDPETAEGEGAEDWRRVSTEIGLTGQYPLSEVISISGTYLYQVFASSLDKSQTRLSTGVDYTPLPGATVSAGVEVVDDPEKGLSSIKGVGLGYEVDPDTSVKLNLFHTEDSSGSVGSGVGAKWGAEFQWKFKF